MPLNIRNDRALELAKTLAEKEGVSITEAVIQSLEQSLQAHDKRESLSARLKKMSRKIKSQAGPNPRPVSKKEIDAFWGQ